MSGHDLAEIIETALGTARADEADAVAIRTDRNITRFANSTIHQNMSERSASLTVRVVVRNRIGVASTTSLDRDSIERATKLARDMAERSDPTEGFKGLVSEGTEVPRLATVDEATAHLSPMSKAEEIKRMFDLGARDGCMFAGSFTTGTLDIATGNTHGLRREAATTSADATVIALRGELSGYATRCSRSSGGVGIEALGEEAASKARLLADCPAQIEPGQYDVILEPAALAEVFEWMNMISFSGSSFEDGSSFFVGNLGKGLLHESFSLTDDALDENFLPFPFDMEGVAKRRVPLVESGILRGGVVDKIMSDRLGVPLTGSAAGLGSSEHGMALHLSMAPGTASREELIASTSRGIWVTRFNYVNGLIDPKAAVMTGMTRDGTFLIEEGRVVARLPNLRWTEPMVEAFSRIDGLTRERRIISTWWNPTGGTIAPTTRIRGWNFTGVQAR
ncbi:MAG TPA: TldD/PmbA family protein [Thermoanaerobaculia bacterium]|nr:TldD/PmbA family protein [Thermoanaerobaculia bacterium]